MAHQMGIPQVVATMGTALNARHVKHLSRYLPSAVVLVFDADAGGITGVDRALEIFVSQEVDLAIATLPAGMDPCDLLVEQGADAFRQILAGAADALDFKLNQVLKDEKPAGIEGRRRAVEAILGVIALGPAMVGPAGAVKRELVISRIAQRLSLREDTLWERLNELRNQRERRRSPPLRRPRSAKAPAQPRERQLLEVLLAEPTLVPSRPRTSPRKRSSTPACGGCWKVSTHFRPRDERPTSRRYGRRSTTRDLAQAATRMQDVGRDDGGSGKRAPRACR